MKEYEFHWQDGKVDKAKGRTPTEAFNALGYGAGAISALDYWKEIK